MSKRFQKERKKTKKYEKQKRKIHHADVGQFRIDERRRRQFLILDCMGTVLLPIVIIQHLYV